MNIVIKELFGSDNILTLTEKLNYNFDQLILGGGGPEGPQGGTGTQGVAGPEGTRGSQWFGGTGATSTTNQPTDGIFRENDFKLDPNGTVDYYTNNAWDSTGIDLTGPAGPQGLAGNGAISLILGALDNNPDWASQAQFTPDYSQLATYLGQNFQNDTDDHEINGVGYINSGVDFIGIGRGNNSLVLGRYASLFKNAASGAIGGTYSPPAGNLTTDNFPENEYDVPMLIIGQNDYQDPTLTNVPFSNGLSIGLTKTHTTAEYDADFPYSGAEMDYNNFANLSISNRYFDFDITAFSMVSLKNTSGLSEFRLGSNVTRGDTTTVADISTKLDSIIYTQFNLNDSILIDLVDVGSFSNSLGFITKADYDYKENKKIFTSNNDLRKNISKSFISNDSYAFGDGNEIVLSNASSLKEQTVGTVSEIGKVVNTYSESNESDSNQNYFPFRLGQTVIDAGVNAGSTATGVVANINLTYQGFGYDQGIVSYSGIDNTNVAGANNIQSTSSALEAVIPNDTTLQSYLGYDILAPLDQQETSLSMTRLGVFPGMFRQEKLKDGSGNFDVAGDPNSDNRKNEFFDTSHKMLPTGSIDLYGTARLRQQGETNDGSQDGWVAVNKKDGIITFEEPNLVNAVPTYAVMTFSEHVSDKFSFFALSGKDLGFTGGNLASYDYKPGGTANCGAFIGKGSQELKDYYVCNGAVLADGRDIITTGPYSKMEGMNVQTANILIEDGAVGTGSTVIYNENSSFEGYGGQTQNTYMVSPTKTLGTFGADICNTTTYGDVRFGYSVLAPSAADSGFRIVLPNYFGRVAKYVQ